MRKLMNHNTAQFLTHAETGAQCGLQGCNAQFSLLRLENCCAGQASAAVLHDQDVGSSIN